MMPGTNVQGRLRAGYHRLRTLSEEYREKARAGLTRSDHYDAVVASFGGNGTSFLLKFLRDYLRVNSWDSANDGIKHANAPNHPVFDGLKVDRGIYVYGDPVIAVASLFRRDFQSHMLAKLTSAAHTDGKDYRRYVKTHQRALTLDEAFAGDADVLGIRAHWENWTRQPVRFPVMFVRFDDFYDHAAEVFDFLGLPPAALDALPPHRARKSSLSHMPAPTIERLQALYGDVIRDMAARPAIFVREPA